MLAVVIATGVYGRHVEGELAALKEWNKTELASLKKWDQDRFERLERQILDLRMNVGEAKSNFSTTKAEAANHPTRGGV